MFSSDRPSETDVLEIFEKAKDDDIRSRQRLLAWVYREAKRYFQTKLPSEHLLSRQDACDLAAESVLEFERVMPHIRSLPRYVRRMFRNNLVRFLRRKRLRMLREKYSGDVLPSEFLEEVVVPDLDSIFGSMTDEQIRHVHIAIARMDIADECTRDIMAFRLAEEPLTYREISDILQSSESALRMRVARFCRNVRDECERVERRRAWRNPLEQV